MHKKILPILLSSILLVGCTTTTPTTIQETSETIEEIIITSETSQETSIETTQETTIETTQFQTSLPYMRTIDFDGEHIPNGTYFISPISYNKKSNELIVNIYGMYYLLDEDIKLLNNGDILYFANHHDIAPINEVNKEEKEHKVTINNSNLYVDFIWSFIKVNDYNVLVDCNGEWQSCITYLICENYTIKLDDNLYIFDSFGIPPFGYEEWHQNYLDGYYMYNDEKRPILYEKEALELYRQQYPSSLESGASYRFRSIEDFIYAWNNLSTMHPAPVIIIKDNKICEMYINPQLHQPWRFVNEETKSIYENELGINTSSRMPSIEIIE